MRRSGREDGAGGSAEPITFRGFNLYPFQELAIRAIEGGQSVLVAAPTGAGKTLIAEYAIEKALKENSRVVYTSPIKALSNQKYRDFTRTYGDRIGIMTGDVTLNPTAPILIMTTEIFRNTIFEAPDRLRDISHVIFDEIHYVDDAERGTVWEESIIFAPESIRFVALSATISNLKQFAAWMAQVRGQPVEVVRMEKRPVPLRHFCYAPELGVIKAEELQRLRRPRRRRRRGAGRERDLLDYLENQDLLPCLHFSFSRKECETRARENLARQLLNSQEEGVVLGLFNDLCRRYELNGDPGVERLRRMIQHGIAYHHAGMLPTHKEIVERIFTSGLIRLLFTTETFALGINMPVRSVALGSIRKFNGVSFERLRTLDYYQMAGRAGRQGIDGEGHVFTRVDLRRDKMQEVRETIFGKVEPIRSKFNLSYSTILNLHPRMGDQIFEAYERSFKSFQKRGKQGRHSKQDRALLERRLELLRRAGFLLPERGLSDKGRFAAQIYGYEVQCAQLHFTGLFRELDPVQLAVLVGAVVYEPRYGEVEKARVPELGDVRREAERVLAEFQRLEGEVGVWEGTRGLEFGLSRAIAEWARGREFADLADVTEVSDGDLVRYFRLTIQLLRQIRHALPPEDLLRVTFARAIELLNRDVVDAEKQLRLG